MTDLLVLHPLESSYFCKTPLDWSKSEGFHKEFEKTLALLTENHYDFDLGDEGIIEKHGRVDGSNFSVGKASYSAVLLPQACCTVL